MEVTLHPHQEKAVADMHNGCVLAGDVGVGKTITALSYALLKEPGRDIYVITTAKKRDSFDWQAEAAKLAIPVDKIFVDSWNNIKHYKNINSAFFIFDEQRLVGTGAWVKSFLDIARKNHWVLLSATPGDSWLDYVPVFVANGFYKNVTDFRQQHVIYARFVKYPKVDRYVNTGKLIRYRAKLIVEMPLERHTTRHINIVECDYDKELFDRAWKKRWHVYEERPLLDAGELFRVGRKIVASHSSRIQQIRDLLVEHPKLIVFYNFDYELDLLRTVMDLAPSSTESDGSPTVEYRCGATESEPSPSQSKSSSNKMLERGTKGSIGPCTKFQDPLSGTWTKDEGQGEMFIPDDPLKGTMSRRLLNSPSDTTSLTQTIPFESKSRKVSVDTIPTSGDPLKGTIWEQGWSPEKESSSTGTLSSSTEESEERSFALAEWNGHKHENVPNTDSWLYLVQYAAGSEGWNCTTTDAMAFYSPTYSYKQYYQAQGRIDRMNTPFTDLAYYVLISKSVVDKAVWRSLQQKKDFNLHGFRF